jgi:TP901 family phage tail tape measure protein|tara:strand:- start:5171 stop:10246 length:5076 start_codon:yes stop_codon:yes gene_type:complete
MAQSFNASLNVQLNTASLNASTKQISNALGRITGQASEFQKSLDASTARVFAFGATTVVLNSITQSFKKLVATTIEVEKRLIEINSIFQATETTFNRFRNSIFQVAKETGQSFSTVAEGAAELARQGLSAEETAKRLKAALVLTRISGLDAEKSVKSLTAAINGFTSAGLSANQIVNKMVAVDTAFAVSAQDLAEAFSRAGSTAEDAGVSFDQLLGLVTAVEQKTARGGAVIGNAFKSIFTRLQRGTTIDELQELGVAIDATMSGVQKLQALSMAIENIADPTVVSKIKELAGGVFQINVVSAALKDIGSETSIFAKATQTGVQATNQAFEKNAALSESMAHNINRLIVGLTSLGEKVGSITFGPLLENLVGIAIKFTEFLDNALDPEKGNNFIRGFFKAISTFLSGPAVVIFTAAFLKIAKLVGKFALDGMKALFKMGTEAEKLKNIQGGIVGLLSRDSALRKVIQSTTATQLQKEQAVIAAIKRENALLTQQAALMRSLAAAAAARGVGGFTQGSGFTGRRGRTFSHGFMAEEASARMLGAPDDVQAHMGTGKINGKDFIMNNYEVEVPRFAGGSDSAVIPLYAGGNIPRYAGGRGQVRLGRPSKPLSERDDITTRDQAIAAGYSPSQVSQRFGAAKKGPKAKKTEQVVLVTPKNMGMLIPSIGRSATIGKKTRGRFKFGGKHMGFEYGGPLEVDGPKVPKAVDQAADPHDENLKKNITRSVTTNAANFAGLLKPVLGKPSPAKILQKLKSQGGGKGALKGIVGAAFEASVNAALDISPARKVEGGDFDVKGVSGKKAGAIRKLFGVSNPKANIFDYKENSRKNSVASFAKKIANEDAAKGSVKFVTREVRRGTKAFAGGHIPRYARGMKMGGASAVGGGSIGKLMGIFDSITSVGFGLQFAFGAISSVIGFVEAAYEKQITVMEAATQKRIEEIEASDENFLMKRALIQEEMRLLDEIKKQPPVYVRLAQAAKSAAIALGALAALNMATRGGLGRAVGKTRAGSFFSGRGTKMKTAEKLKGQPNRMVEAQKAGKRARFIRGGGAAAALFGAYDIGSTLMNEDLTKRQKIVGVSESGGAIAGGLAGAAGGAKLGAVLAPFLGPAAPLVAAITTFGGGIIGAVGGGMAAGKAAEALTPKEKAIAEAKEKIAATQKAVGVGRTKFDKAPDFEGFGDKKSQIEFLNKSLEEGMANAADPKALADAYDKAAKAVEEQQKKSDELLAAAEDAKDGSKKRNKLAKQLRESDDKLAKEQDKLANVIANISGWKYKDLQMQMSWQADMDEATATLAQAHKDYANTLSDLQERQSKITLKTADAFAQAQDQQALVQALATGPNALAMNMGAGFQTQQRGLDQFRGAIINAQTGVDTAYAETSKTASEQGRTATNREMLQGSLAARNNLEKASQQFESAARKAGIDILSKMKQVGDLQMANEKKMAELTAQTIQAQVSHIQQAFGQGGMDLDYVHAQGKEIADEMLKDPADIDYEKIGMMMSEYDDQGTGVSIDKLVTLFGVHQGKLEEVLAKVADAGLVGGEGKNMLMQLRSGEGESFKDMMDDAKGLDATAEMDELLETQRGLNKAMAQATKAWEKFATDSDTADIAKKLKETQEKIESGEASVDQVLEFLDENLQASKDLQPFLAEQAKFAKSATNSMKMLANKMISMENLIKDLMDEEPAEGTGATALEPASEGS